LGNLWAKSGGLKKRKDISTGGKGHDFTGVMAADQKNDTYRLILAFLDLVSQQILWPTGDIENHQQRVEEPED